MSNPFDGDPFYDVIVVERKAPEKKIGSIIIAPSALEQEDQGVVIAVGEGKLLDDGRILPLKVKVGDHILYSKYANLEFKWNGKTFVTMREADIILRFNSGEAK